MNLRSLIIKTKPETLIVLSLSLIFIIFGLLKIFGMSPVESVVSQIADMFGKGMFFVLGIIEVALGLGLLISRYRFVFSVLILLHLIGVSLISILFPGFLFSSETVLTIEGQFVLKNLVLIAAVYYLVWSKVESGNQTK